MYGNGYLYIKYICDIKIEKNLCSLENAAHVYKNQ